MILSYKIIITLSIIFIIANIIYYNKNIENFYNEINFSNCNITDDSLIHISNERGYSLVERAYWAYMPLHNNQIIDIHAEYPEEELRKFSSTSPDEAQYFKDHGKKHKWWNNTDNITKIWISNKAITGPKKSWQK